MRKLFTAIAVAIVLSPPAWATNGMRMIGFGPVQNAMGGVGVAIPLDASVLVTNPAGIAALAPRLDLAGQAFMPSVEYDAVWTPDGSTMMPASQESDRPTDLLPTIASVYRVQDRLTVGVAALGTAGMGVEYAKGTAGLYASRTYTSYVNGRLAPAVAYRVTDQLAIGLAANVMYSQMAWEVADAMGGPKHETAGSLGFGATLGLTYQPTPMVTVGAAYETRSFFQDFEFQIAGQTQALEFDQPMVATIGVAVRPVGGLVVALDGQWINWSDTMGEKLPKWSSNPLGESDWNMNWSDQFVVKLGAEYAIPSLQALRVRAGWNWGQTPLDEARAFENVAFPAIAEHHFTVGAGYEIGKWGVNFAAVYSPEASLEGSNPLEQGIVSYESRMSQLAFELGGAYRF